MHRFLALGLLLVVLPLTGCLEDEAQDCEPLHGHATVETVTGNDVQVGLDDGQPAVLHLSQQVFVLSNEACQLVGPEGVRVGDQVTFEVDAWAESYPMQGWPETAVVLR